MNKSERLELQRQLTNAEAKFLKYRGSGVIPTPKALRYRRTADELRRQIARMDREAAEQYAIAQTPIEDIIEVMIVPLLADVMNDIVAGVDASLRRNGISGTVYGIFTQQIRKCCSLWSTYSRKVTKIYLCFLNVMTKLSMRSERSS